MSTYQFLTPIADLIPEGAWPSELPLEAATIHQLLDGLYVTDYDLRSGERSLRAAMTLVVLREIGFALPGLGGTRVVLAGAAGEGTASARLSVALDADGYEVGLEDVQLALRFPPHLLRPVSPAPGVTHAELSITGSFYVDHNLDVRIEGGDAISLAPVMIGGSGIVLSADRVQVALGRSSVPPEIIAAGFDDSFVGVFIEEARITLPPGLPLLAPEDLILRNAAIGSGGFAGALALDYGEPDWDAAARAFRGRGAGDFFGVPMAVRRLELEIRDNAFLRAELQGRLMLPYFERLLDVTIAIGLGGELTLTVTGAVESGDSHDAAAGLLHLHRAGVADLDVASLGIEARDGKLWFVLGGTVTPLFAGLDWPALEIQRLAIDTNGDVAVEGGWLELPEQYGLDFHGFQLELARIGFGRGSDGGRWLGVSGGLKLVEGLPATTSVEGLRVSWYDDGHTAVTFSGITVALDIKDVLSLSGTVAYDAAASTFRGAVKVALTALDLAIDGQVVVQRGAAGNALAVYLGVELPAGIPLFTTGLSLYGMAGLFARNMEPDRAPDQRWYAADGNSWYHAGAPGVTDLGKWRASPGSLAFGAGVTIGTTADNGHAFSARALLAIVFPGPILLIEGAAGFLRDRAKLASGEPPFRALAVLDRRERTFLVGVDAAFSYDDEGRLIDDLHGSAEAFFDLDDAGNWYVRLGEREPRERRIGAELFKLFDADAYLGIEPRKLSAGARLSVGDSWSFGPLSVTLEAWMEANAVLSWKPGHFHGDLALGGTAALRAFGVGASITAEAMIEADVFDPFHLLGQLRVKLGLPWPIPDISRTVALEWGPTVVTPLARVPRPLQEVNLEHLKTTETWAPPLLESGVIPVVPLDARPRITFGRAVHDDALVGINGQPVDAASELLGDPTTGQGPVRIRLGLREMALQAWRANAWRDVARKGPGANPPGIPTLFGSWAPMPQLGTGDPAVGTPPSTANVKLWLWSKTPFDHTRHTSSNWDEWFGEQQPGWPCIPPPRPRDRCCDDLPAQLPPTLWRCEPGKLFVLWRGHGEEEGATVTIGLDEAAMSVRIDVRDEIHVEDDLEAIAYDATPVELTRVAVTSGTRIELVAPGIRQMVVQSKGALSPEKICATYPPAAAEVAEAESLEQHLQEETTRWNDAGFVLEPYTRYRLRIVTTAQVTGVDDPLLGHTESHVHDEYAYFNTEGPPAELTRYVRTTVPVTAQPPGGERRVARPVFCNYDLGVEFNEDYVDLMYRLARRDLTLQLADNNDRPVRDRDGRLLVIENRWGRVAQRVLTESEQQWVEVIDANGCADIDVSTASRQQTLAVAGLGLTPDTLYRARLVPLRFADGFAMLPAGTVGVGPAGQFGDWDILDEGTQNAPSRWQVGLADGAGFVTQTSNIQGGPLSGLDPRKPGTTLLVDDLEHADFRLTATLGAPGGGAMGLVFRHRGAGTFYRFLWDRGRRVRSLVRSLSGAFRVLAIDDVTYLPSRDYQVTVEAIGPSLRLYVGGELVFDVSDDAIATGKVGLWCWANPGVRFANVRVDDLAHAAEVAFGFDLATSRFAHFLDHVHSFAERTWDRELDHPTAAGIRALVPRAGASGAVPTVDESRAFDQAEVLLGAAEPVTVLTATRLTAFDGRVALLVQSPEPIDWARTDLTVTVAPERHPPAPARVAAAGPARIVGLETSELDAEHEQVTVLARTALALDDHTLDVLGFPGPEAIDAPALLLRDSFDGPPAGLVHVEGFGPNALDHFRVVDRGVTGAPSAWSSAGEILQSSSIGSDPDPADPEDRPGTVALLQTVSAPDLRLTTRLRTSGAGGSHGLVFRWTDDDNHYRLSFEPGAGRRVLIKRVAGVTEVLWEDTGAVFAAQSDVVLAIHGDHLVGWMGERLMFSVHDAAHPRGQLGVHCWRYAHARVWRLEVETLHAPIALWEPLIALHGRLAQRDLGDAVARPTWGMLEGALMQVGAPSARGTVAVSPEVLDGSYGITARLAATAGAERGVIVGLADNGDHLRFTRTATALRLVRSQSGADTVLWQTAVTGADDATYELALRLDHDRVTVLADGVVHLDRARFGRFVGRAGVFYAGPGGLAVGALFADDRTRRVGAWEVNDLGNLAGPSRWRALRGELWQSSNIHDPGGDGGTHVVAGDAAWTDVQLTVDLRSDDGDPFGVLFRHVDGDSYYRFTIEPDAGRRSLYRYHDGIGAMLWEQSAGLTLGTPARLRIVAVGSRLRGELDGEPLFDLEDGQHATGKIGLHCWRNPGACFAAVEVTTPPRLERATVRDRFSAGDIGGWTIVDTGGVGGPSEWELDDGWWHQRAQIHGPPPDDGDAAPGTLAMREGEGEMMFGTLLRTTLSLRDRGAAGVVFRFRNPDNHYRFSVDPRAGHRLLVRRSGGVTERLWSDGFEAERGVAYDVVVRAVGSRISVWWNGLPICDVEDASGLTKGFVGLYARDRGAAFSDVWALPVDGPVAPPATITAASELDAGAHDHRISVQLGGDPVGTVGVVARRSHPETFYALVVDHDNRRIQLRRHVEGLETVVLWDDELPRMIHDRFVLSLACEGARLTASVDGIALRTLEDSASLEASGAGVFVDGNEGASFALLELAAATWIPLHRFAPQTVAAGTRLVIHGRASGPAPGAVQPALVLPSAPPGTRGHPRLRAPVALRIADRDGRALHVHDHRPAGDFAAAPARLLRKADGTAFLLYEANPALVGPEHRLELLYRRDDRASRPDAPVLSEQGVHEPEIAVIRCRPVDIDGT